MSMAAISLKLCLLAKKKHRAMGCENHYNVGLQPLLANDLCETMVVLITM